MSYLRETYDQAGYRIAATWPAVDRGLVVLEHTETGKRELWQHRPHFAGYAITIAGQTYEFVRSLDSASVSRGLS